MPRIPAKVDESGCLTIPPELRAELGLEGAGELLLTVVDGELRAITRVTAGKRAQEMMRPHIKPGMPSLVDELIADRRAEAARFAAGYSGGER
jgi:bifunctional DNA-binding transcriptional regulator/antitoxin component of YhaV-PrlF toxin-antitoxin module